MFVKNRGERREEMQVLFSCRGNERVRLGSLCFEESLLIVVCNVVRRCLPALLLLPPQSSQPHLRIVVAVFVTARCCSNRPKFMITNVDLSRIALRQLTNATAKVLRHGARQYVEKWLNCWFMLSRT